MVFLLSKNYYDLKFCASKVWQQFTYYCLYIEKKTYKKLEIREIRGLQKNSKA